MFNIKRISKRCQNRVVLEDPTVDSHSRPLPIFTRLKLGRGFVESDFLAAKN